ncbi:MAG: hypothetical protein ACLQDY_06625 [Streptosporangiaceae bacterium]
MLQLEASTQGAAMALTEAAQQLYQHLGHKASNPAVLKRRLKLDDDTLRAACDELISEGIAEWDGGRLRQTDNVGATGLSLHATRILARLPQDGTAVGQIRMRGLVDLSNDEYRKAVEELAQAQLVRLGRGRGGSLARQETKLDTGPAPEETTGLVQRESELYRPLLDWLQSTLESQGGFFWDAQITANPQGRRRSSGQWSRPDVTSVEVWRSEWLPQINLTISSYEVKRFCDAERLESVYEAKAHGRWAHRSNLVLEAPRSQEWQPPDEVLDEIKRFDLGLYLMIRREDNSYRIRQMIPPGAQHPEPALQTDLLEYYFRDDKKSAEQYKSAIH